MLTLIKSEIKRDADINKNRDDANNHQITKSKMLTLTKIERWVFSCLCNPPDSDTDYRICNVSTRLFLYTPGGWGTPTASQHNVFEPIRENKLVKPRECFHSQSRVDRLID